MISAKVLHLFNTLNVFRILELYIIVKCCESYFNLLFAFSGFSIFLLFNSLQKLMTEDETENESSEQEEVQNETENESSEQEEVQNETENESSEQEEVLNETETEKDSSEQEDALNETEKKMYEIVNTADMPLKSIREEEPKDEEDDTNETENPDWWKSMTKEEKKNYLNDQLDKYWNNSSC
jgi:hypothetical protein